MTIPNTFELSIDVSIRQSGSYGPGNLQIRETIEIPAASFLELAKILGLFHDLALRLKAQHS